MIPGRLVTEYGTRNTRARIERRIDELEATIARLAPAGGAPCPPLYCGELASARTQLRFAITDLSLLDIDEATAAE